MQRRRLGQLEVSAVGLGCGTMTPFYGEPDRAAGIATIRRAREIGVDLLDTADGYGRGRNEELVAEAVRGHRGDYVIASKFGNLGLLGDPRFADGRPKYVREACEKSLGRLNTDVIGFRGWFAPEAGHEDLARYASLDVVVAFIDRRLGG